MLFFIGLLAITLPAVALLVARSRTARRHGIHAEPDRPAWPGAESQGVPAAGSIGPTTDPVNTPRG